MYKSPFGKRGDIRVGSQGGGHQHHSSQIPVRQTVNRTFTGAAPQQHQTASSSGDVRVSCCRYYWTLSCAVSCLHHNSSPDVHPCHVLLLLLTLSMIETIITEWATGTQLLNNWQLHSKVYRWPPKRCHNHSPRTSNSNHHNWLDQLGSSSHHWQHYHYIHGDIIQ